MLVTNYPFTWPGIYSYEEMGMSIYGEATYRDGILTDIALEDEDLEQYSHDEDNDCYVFKGESYDDDLKIPRL